MKIFVNECSFKAVPLDQRKGDGLHQPAVVRRLCIQLLLLATLFAYGCNNGTTPKNGAAPHNATGPDMPVVKNQSPPEITKLDYARAVALRTQGVAHLENKEWDDALAALSELADLLPTNRLAVRNLAVARVLALIDRESQYTRSGPPQNVAKFNAAVTSATEAVTAFRETETEDYDNYDKALADLLLGKLLIHSDSPETPSFEQGLAALRSAADARPDAADFRFALAMAMDGNRDYSDGSHPKSAQLLEALSQSFKLAPENLFALQKLLQRQALFLNAKNAPTKKLAEQIPETLKAAVELLAPLNESIKKQRRMDLVETINKSLSSFDGTNATPLMQPAMITANLLLPDIATQIDQRRLNKNLLEYLLLDFDAVFLRAMYGPGRTWEENGFGGGFGGDPELIPAAIPEVDPTVVKAFIPTDGMPAITGVTQVELLDMNLDGFDDLVVAREGNIEVYSRGTDLSAAWQLMMSSPEAATKLTEFLLVDIDRDYDKALSDIKNPSLLRDTDGDQKIVTDPAEKNRWYDTDLDVIGWSDAGVVVFRNNLAEDGARSLEVVSQEESLININDVVAADLEADGDLDLIFATDAGMTLWKNIDGTIFQNMNDSASLPKQGLLSLAAVDWNSDVAIDVVGLSSNGAVGYLQNILHGRFRWMQGMVDDSHRWTVVVTGPSAGSGASGGAMNPESISIVQAFGRSEITQPGTHTVPADLDNDGKLEAIRNIDGELSVSSESFSGKELPELQTIRKVLTHQAADIDDDGDLDIIYVAADDGSLGLLTNDGGNANNWIDVVARAVPDDPQFPSNRVNMHGIGSTIEMRTGGLYLAEVISKPKVHLGLGKATAADAIRIIWTDGIPQNITVPNLLKPRIGILAPQILKGSCPYIYTWTGERFEFFSDCLWAAPLGLVQANGDLAPTREWENLLIPGEVLVEKDGRYVLQLTEELWETAYFDQVQLTTIDHPVDVEIFTNEKVGPPSMAAHRVHTVKNARLPVSVTDGRGNDLLPGLSDQDGDYIQPFEGRVMQGLTDEWTMEFDLGKLEQPTNVRLFLVGWVFPTDTSLNLGIEQNPKLAGPAPPSIEIPNGNGGWKVVRPFIGFPSGKTKAMVVDISDIFENDDYRFRINSSMELYWDQAFFTVDETDAETVVQPCGLTNSDLHFRGFSHRTYANNALFRYGHAPESYDYESVTTEARWPPIAGRFTRYGNTTPLLGANDDQMVVMGPGDELTVTFAVPSHPVPQGWKRDFVLTNVGYDKDADLNTVYGQSSEPLPFKAMTRYPFAAEEDVPESPEYSQHLDKWQSREYSPLTFRNAVRNAAKK